jgi:HPt (histidine-containing phosphotransfer) domain-containing protein
VSETNAVNPAAIERLCKLGGSPFAARMIDLFITYCGEKVVAARQARSAENLAAVAEAAHPIKSSAGNVGALCVQDLAARVEHSAKSADLAHLDSELAALEQAFAEAKVVLETQKAQLPAKSA